MPFNKARFYLIVSTSLLLFYPSSLLDLTSKLESEL